MYGTSKRLRWTKAAPEQRSAGVTALRVVPVTSVGLRRDNRRVTETTATLLYTGLLLLRSPASSDFIYFQF